jgi:hypothetical protein
MCFQDGGLTHQTTWCWLLTGGSVKAGGLYSSPSEAWAFFFFLTHSRGALSINILRNQKEVMCFMT